VLNKGQNIDTEIQPHKTICVEDSPSTEKQNKSHNQEKQRLSFNCMLSLPWITVQLYVVPSVDYNSIVCCPFRGLQFNCMLSLPWITIQFYVVPSVDYNSIVCCPFRGLQFNFHGFYRQMHTIVWYLIDRASLVYTINVNNQVDATIGSLLKFQS
jgi:hypothetical protein